MRPSGGLGYHDGRFGTSHLSKFATFLQIKRWKNKFTDLFYSFGKTCGSEISAKFSILGPQSNLTRYKH